MIKAFSSQSKIRIRSFIILKSLEGSTCSSGNILNRNLEKENAYRDDKYVSVRGAHFKPRWNFFAFVPYNAPVRSWAIVKFANPNPSERISYLAWSQMLYDH